MNKNQLKSFVLFSLVLVASIFSLFTSEKSIEELQKHFKNLEFQHAIEQAEKLLKNSKLAPEDKVKVYIIKGVSEFSINRTLDSKITFAELIFFDQNINLDSKEISPKIISFFNDLKKQLDINRSETILTKSGENIE